MRIVTYNHKPQVIKGVVMECMGFSLDKYLPQFQHDPLEIAHELCFLVAHMHEHHIVHLDLKPWNFLCLPMGDRVQIKLGDFGTARKMTNPPPILSRPVSTHTSPETDHYPIEATYAMDIWSLGLTVVSVLYVSGPKTNHDFSIMSDGIPEVTDYFANQIAELTKDDKEVGTVLKGMLDPYPASRWTAQRASLAFALAKLSALDRRLKGMLPISQNAASLGATSESVCEAMW
jgi:serine/threonine protein kinase